MTKEFLNNEIKFLIDTFRSLFLGKAAERLILIVEAFQKLIVLLIDKLFTSMSLKLKNQ